MTKLFSDECRHRGVHALTGQFSGATLVSMDTGEEITREKLLDIDGKLLSSVNSSIATQDPVTGIISAGMGTRMKQHDGALYVITPNTYCVNPSTGKLVPIQGNIMFNPVLDELVYTVDILTGSNVLLDSLLPYVPYPTNPNTGQPVNTGLKMFKKLSELKLGATMADPLSGINVPVCAVTIHPQTRARLPVGGTYTDPITGIIRPIEIGAMMLNRQHNTPAIIVGIRIDSSGRVLPVGGEVVVNGISKPLLLHDQFSEPLSSLTVFCTSASIDSDASTVIQNYGGAQHLLDTNELLSIQEVILAAQKLKEVATSHDIKEEFVFQHAMSNLLQTQRDVSRNVSRNQTLHLQELHRLSLLADEARKLCNTGGSPGFMEYTPTGQLLPVLLGMEITDPAGTGIHVPILNWEQSSQQTGILIPLAGTMECPQGRGTVPIVIGQKALDEVTNELMPIYGVRRKPDTKVVVPSTQPVSQKRKFTKQMVSYFCTKPLSYPLLNDLTNKLLHLNKDSTVTASNHYCNVYSCQHSLMLWKVR